MPHIVTAADVRALENALVEFEKIISEMDNKELTCLSGVLYFNRTLLLEDYDIYDRLLDTRNARVYELNVGADQDCKIHHDTQTMLLKHICDLAEKVTPARITKLPYNWYNGAN